jgi:hypothetical protein
MFTNLKLWYKLRYCSWHGHNFKTFDHPKYLIYKIKCLRCGFVLWDGGFEEKEEK